MILTLLTGCHSKDQSNNTFNGIVQDDIERAKGCGTGCTRRRYQLTDPEDIEEGWRRVKVMSTTYVFNYQTREDEPYGGRLGLHKAL